MNRLIVSAFLDDKFERLKTLTLPSIAAYAQWLGISLKLLDYGIPLTAIPAFTKFWIYELLDEYDEILWLDADVLISPIAPSIFEAANGRFAAFDETQFVKQRSVQLAEYILEIKGERVDPRSLKYFNTGVMVIPRSAKPILDRKDPDLLKAIDLSEREKIPFWEQSYFNLKIREHDIPVAWLSDSWNMFPISKNWQARARVAHIIHYAGLGKNDPKTVKMIEHDKRMWRI